MNLESLIQETAKKVIANMQENPKTENIQSGANQKKPDINLPLNSEIIVVLDGTGEGFEYALSELNTIKSSGLCSQVVVSKTVDITKIAVQGLEIIQPRAIIELVNDCIIYVPYLSVGLSGKLANLIEDEAAARILTRGIIGQHKVFIGISELDLLLGGKKRLSFGLSQRLKEYHRLLKSYDVVAIKDVNQVLKACNTNSSQSGMAAKGNEALLASGSKAPGCTIGSTGCEGCGKCVILNETGVKNLIDTGANRVSASPGLKQISDKVAGMIDHTLLKPNATEADVIKLCEEARKYQFASVCVNPSYVSLASRELAGSGVKVCTVIGFPLGATTSTTKAMETRDAIANGATEIDMVINVGALKSGNNALVKKDIEAVVEAAKGKAIVKVILETSLLTDEEKVRACLLSKYAGADFVKTATGFGPGGATVDDIALMRKTVGGEMGVKASGGIRDLKTAQAMIAAGASRIGASASVAIVKGTEEIGGKGY